MPKRKNDEKMEGNQKYAKKQKEPVSIEDDAGDSKGTLTWMDCKTHHAPMRSTDL